jgi:hypothetical protein
LKWAGCHDLPLAANAQQATNTPFARSSNMPVVAKVEPALKYDILDITSQLICIFGMGFVVPARRNSSKFKTGKKHF